jgi:hypothetical protein
VLPMSKRRKKISAGRPRPRRTSSVGGRRGHSAASTRSVPFTALSEAQWEAIRATRNDWPEGVDWRKAIERLGRAYWDAEAFRKTWVKKLQGKRPAIQRKKILTALKSTQQSQKAVARLMDDGLLDDDFPYPDLDTPAYRLNQWLSDYDVWVQPFAGQSNPIKAELEWRLMGLWKKAGGKLAFSRKKDDPGTPYSSLVNFLSLTLHAIMGREPAPSGIARMIERHRGKRGSYSPFKGLGMHFRILGIV